MEKYIVFQYSDITGNEDSLSEIFVGWASSLDKAKEMEDHCWEHGGDYIRDVKIFEVKEVE